MLHSRLVAVIFLLGCSLQSLAGSFDTRTGSFEDSARSRSIPYKIYYPKPLDARYPVIIVSHGLGGSREANESLGKHLASNGFVTIHIQHAGSDEALIKGARSMASVQAAMQRSMLQPGNALNRFLDVPFVVSQLAVLNDSDKLLKGHLNLDALGMAGHSYGAISTMVAAGERMGVGYVSAKVPSIRAGLLLSPSPPREGADVAQTYADVKIPLFHMTGTEDVSLVEGRNIQPSDRLKPYRLLNIPHQYLLVLDNADHASFADRHLGARDTKQDKKHMSIVIEGALAFFRAYLKDDKDAEMWLRNDYKKQLASGDQFEFK